MLHEDRHLHLFQISPSGEFLKWFGSNLRTELVRCAEIMSQHDPAKFPLESWVFSSEPLWQVSTNYNTVCRYLLDVTQAACSPVVKVVFRKWRKKDGDVIALFPELCASCDGGYLCESYEHTGQHGGADYDCVMQATRRATPEEYAALKNELESAPYRYKLEPRLTRTPAMRRVFMIERSRILNHKP